MSRKIPTGLRVSGACLAVLALAIAYPASPGALSSSIVISQVYGGGGNSGAPLNRDFVELFNRGDAPVSLAGWSIQYASATGTGSFSGNTPVSLSGTLAPGQYYLVGLATGANGSALPPPDIEGAINMSGTGGKVALVNTTTGLACNGGSTPCSAAQLAQIVDLVGWDGANFFEGTAAPATSSATAVIRGDFGCAETDNNGADFTAAAPAPRSSASALHPCTASQPVLTINDVSVAEGDSGTTTATFTVSLSATSAAAVSFDISTADDSATLADADYAANSLAAQVIPAGQQTYTFDVTVNGDTNVEPNESFFVNVTNVTGAIAGDAHGIGTITNDDVSPVVYDVVISQVYGGGGNSGATYTNDFVELFNRGTTPVNLSGWTIQYLSASGSTTWSTTPLTGTIQPGRYYLVQESAGAGGTTGLPTPDAIGTIALGSTAGKVLLRTNNTAVVGACTAGATIVDIVGYNSTATCFEGAPTSPLTNATAALRKRGGCYDSNNNAGDFSITSPTPRNSASPARACEYSTVAIHDIQGTTATTPYFGLDVTTTGIVTGLKSNGMFLQSTQPDLDPSTSEGIFVFTGGVPAATVGAEVVVKGTATEYFNLTQIESTLTGDVSVVTPDNPLPEPVALTPAILAPTGTADQLERLEGMRVQTGTLTSVSPSDGFGEVFTVLEGVARPMREPGAPASATLPPDPVTGLPDCCVPRWDENPERLVIDTDGLLGSTRLYVTSNVTLSGVTGPLDYTFGAYKVLPEATPTASPNMSAVPVPAPAANEFTIAGYNIENFAGAATQRQKAALNIRTNMHSPDIIGVIEILDLPTLEALATQVNSDASAAGETNPQYEARLIPAPAGGSQNVGFLVKASRVQIHDVWQYAGNDKLPNGAFLHDRPPLVLDATVDPNGVNPGRVLVVVNHPRSFIDIELTDAEGARVRAKRTAQAESIATLLQDLQGSNANTPVISVGDYNAYEFSDGYTDPISVITGHPTPGDQIVEAASPDLVTPDFINLTNTLPADQRYSFVFEGTPQALDHVMVNDVAHRYLQRYAVSRSNADFPDGAAAGYAGDATRPERNSDHDQPVAYFAFPGTPVVTLNGSATMNVEAFTSFTDPGATAHDDFGPLPVTTSGSVDVNVPGTYTISYTATNLYQSSTVTRTVIVADTTAPAIAGYLVTPGTLGSPNHELIDVAAPYTVTDASGTASCGITVTSNEPINGLGDGNTNVDWLVLDAHHLRLRAERSGLGSGRTYTVTLTCGDASGNTSVAVATVSVGK